MVQSINNISLVPYIHAERVIHEYMESEKIGLPETKFEQLTTLLVKKCERIYENNETWRNGLIKAKDSREYLCTFMTHWLNSEMNTPNIPLVQKEMFNVISQLNLF